MDSSTGATDAGARAHRGVQRARVVLCTRDRPALLAGALEALRDAGLHGDGVLVVDSGSTTAETMRVAADAGVRSLRSDVPGLSIARNAGLAAADSDIVIYTDDDCVVQPGFAERLVAAFDDPAVAAATGLLRDAADAKPTPDDAPNRTLRRTLEGLDAGHGALMAFRRDVLRGLGGFDAVLGAGRRFGGAEDLDAFCRVLAAGHAVVHVPSAVVRHVHTRSDDDYVALNRAYGRGIGAMGAKWRRIAPGDGRALLAVATRRAVRRLVRRWRDGRGRRAQLAFLSGMREARREARRLPLAGSVFADPRPPAPVVLTAERGAV